MSEKELIKKYPLNEGDTFINSAGTKVKIISANETEVLIKAKKWKRLYSASKIHLRSSLNFNYYTNYKRARNLASLFPLTEGL